MYRLSVPISTKTLNKDTRERYLKLLKAAGAERVFLCGIGEPAENVPERVYENVDYFKSEGFEVGLWIPVLGHGFVLVGAQDSDDRFAQIVSIDGQKLSHANCPLDESYRKYFAEFVAKLARTGADVIMFDDDFRISQREEDISCACPLHMKRISELLGEEVTREFIRPYVVSGKPNKYRDAWLKVQGESLMLLAKQVRAAVDESAPGVTLCTCMAESGWNVGGVDVLGVAKALAGENRPILRLTGAPYWAATGNYTLVAAIEEARMLASFCRGEDIDLMCEGDVYPRPRYTCPASYLELYETAMRADGGYGGILKYMFDYIAGPDFETGYLYHHNENKPYRENISKWFEGGANAGVRIISRPHTMKSADLDLSSLYAWSPVSFDGAMIASSGIPTVYHGKGACNSVFGENARDHDISELENGTVLDAVSAVILTERGIDVGLRRTDGLERKNITLIRTADPECKSHISEGTVRVLNASLDERATPVLYFPKGSDEQTLAYTYENAKGERFLVFLFETDSMRKNAWTNHSGLIKNYCIADVFAKTLPWVARKNMPACCTGDPELAIICRREADSMAIVMLNCFADALTKPIITLDEEYKSIECVGCTASLDKNKITLTSKLHGFCSASVRVRK